MPTSAVESQQWAELDQKKKKLERLPGPSRAVVELRLPAEERGLLEYVAHCDFDLAPAVVVCLVSSLRLLLLLLQAELAVAE